MRIAYIDFVCDPAQPGATGLSDVVWDMASRLAHLGEEVHVVAPYTVGSVPDDAVQVHRFSLPPINYRNILGHLLIVFAAYRRLLTLGKLDVVHVPEYLSAAALGAFLTDTPVVVTEPGNIYERVAHGNPYDPVTTLVYKVAARHAAATCARLVATSGEMAQWWQRTGVSPDRICRVPLGVDTRKFARIADAKAALGLPEDVPLILYAARLSRENGLNIALRALARLRERGGQVQLHVLGEGPQRHSLMELSRELGIHQLVTWHGWVDFCLLPRFYSAADVFVFSGLSGGTPRVLLQAMACGAPVVASKIGGVVDHVTHGETGLLFSAGDEDAMAEQVLRVLVEPDLRKKLSHNACAYARREVDWDVLAPRLLEMYRAVAGRVGRGQ